MPNQNQRPTLASVSQRIDALDAELERARRVRTFDSSESNRTRCGTTRANMRAEQAHQRVDDVEERTGLLETTTMAIIDRLSLFAGMFRSQREDIAAHEERISHHQVRISSLEARAEADGNIVGVWAVTMTVVEVFIFLAWMVMKNFRNGIGQKLGDTPSYDSVFIWLAIGSAVVITVVAFYIYMMRERTPLASRHSESIDTVDTHADMLEVSDAEAPTEAMPPVVVDDDETQPIPVIR